MYNITFSRDGTIKKTENLDSEKAHGHDRISIQILKVCGPSLCETLEFIFKSCLEIEIIPVEWKKRHIVLAHPNKNKYIANYRPIQPFLLYIKMFFFS